MIDILVKPHNRCSNPIYTFCLFVVLLGSMIGMIIDRNPSSKSSLCYETFFSTIPAIMPLRPCEINEMNFILVEEWMDCVFTYYDAPEP